MQKNKRWFGFFGLTDDYLLIALLEGGSKIISWTSRIPLDVKVVRIKKSLIPSQYKVRIEFYEGLPCNMRVLKKVYGIKSQEENLIGFVRYIKERQISNLQ